MPAVVEMSSTPHGAMDSSSASDKKRNKLGYHRTSVACGMFFLPLFFFSTGLLHPERKKKKKEKKKKKRK